MVRSVRGEEMQEQLYFEVENILSGVTEEVHGRRLKFLRNKSSEVEEEVRNHLSYQQDELLTIKDFDDIRNLNGQIEILVHWRGLSEEE